MLVPVRGPLYQNVPLHFFFCTSAVHELFQYLLGGGGDTTALTARFVNGLMRLQRTRFVPKCTVKIKCCTYTGSEIIKVYRKPRFLQFWVKLGTCIIISRKPLNFWHNLTCTKTYQWNCILFPLR